MSKNSESDMRYTKFIERLPLNKYNVTKTAIEAGFSETTARRQQKRIMAKALEIQAKRVHAMTSDSKTPLSTLKRSMTDIIGLSEENVFELLRKIASQEKDLASALKVLAPLAKEHGVILNAEENVKVTVPVLNVTVKERPVEPLESHVAQSVMGDVTLDEEARGAGATSEADDENTPKPLP